MSEKQPSARAVFRWLAGLSVPVFVLLAVGTAFPQLVGDKGGGNVVLAILFAWGALCFSAIAITGRLPTAGRDRMLLFVEAKKFVNGEMTLDEYGERTKEILGS